MRDSKRPIKIVMVTDCLFDLTGGAERQIFELVKGLDRARFEPAVVSLECGGAAPPGVLDPAGCRVQAFPVKRIYGLSGLLEGFRFWRFLRRFNPDVVMTFHFSSDIWATVFARLAGVKTIVSNRRDLGFWRKPLHDKAYRWVNRWVSRVVVNAAATGRKIAVDEGYPSERIHAIYNGIDLAAMDASAAAEADLPAVLRDGRDDRVIIMHIANLRPVKGHTYLLEALAGIIPHNPQVHAVLIGEDRLDGALALQAARLGIGDHVHCLGKRSDARQLLPLSDICVMPSLSEGLSNAIMEYMAAGKPVVATGVGGNPELVSDGITGRIVPPEDPASLRAALEELIDDPQRREAFGRAGRKKMETEFSIARMIKNYEDLFSSCAAAPAGEDSGGPNGWQQEGRETRMKILHLISSGGFFGAENVVLKLGRYFQGSQHEVIIGALRDSRHPQTPLLERAEALGLPTYALPCDGRFDLKAIFRLRKDLRHQGITILHTHNYKSDLIGALSARLAGVPVVATAHGFTDVTAAVSWYESLDRYVLRNCFRKVAVMTEQMLPGLAPEKKRVIKNGIELDLFTPDPAVRKAQRERFGFRPDDCVVATVGRLSKEKNQMHLLKAMNILFRDFAKLRLLIVGDGPQRAALERYVEVRRWESRVTFTGIIQDIAPVYQAMDVFVLPSLTEGVPLTLLEAMAAEVPVVATPVGGVPEIISNRENGILVQPDDLDALTGALRTLLRDPQQRQRLARAGQTFVKERHTIENMGEAYLALYNEVLA